ncbi:hypothetical protein [Marinobacter sp.]|uniref:hypothetical protein n=1 Tax=Marinobacter sp. TaxID=50741 RepID=UPI0034A134B8
MKRLMYLVDTIDSVESISEDLHERGISDWRFHIVSKDESGLYTHRLHSASVLDRTDMPRFVERGMIIGAVFSLFFVMPLAVWGTLGWPVSAFIAMGAFAIIAGGWLGGFGGIGTENYRIRKFHGDIEAGRHLVMVDVPKADVAQMKELMALNHPEAELQGESSSLNNPLAAADGRVHLVH